MELTKSMVISFFLVVILRNSMAYVYQINVDHNNWTSNQIFQVGDVVIFQYNAHEYHKVLQVNWEDYNSCSAKSAIATYIPGNDSISFPSTGDYYYISSFPPQCDAGQRVHIKVGSTSASLPNNNTLLSLGKVPKPPIPFPPHVVAYPYPRSSASIILSSKCLITTMLGLTLVADFYLFFFVF